MKFHMRFENGQMLLLNWSVLPRLHEHVRVGASGQAPRYGLVHDIRYEADEKGEPDVTVFVTERPLPK